MIPISCSVKHRWHKGGLAASIYTQWHCLPGTKIYTCTVNIVHTHYLIEFCPGKLRNSSTFSQIKIIIIIIIIENMWLTMRIFFLHHSIVTSEYAQISDGPCHCEITMKNLGKKATSSLWWKVNSLVCLGNTVTCGSSDSTSGLSVECDYWTD